MKNEKISVFVLAVEIAAIICLHTLKGSISQERKIEMPNVATYKLESHRVEPQLAIPFYSIYTIKH